MICRCTECGKIFDTDVEVGHEDETGTYCETCSVEKGFVDYEDKNMASEEAIIALLNGEAADEALSEDDEGRKIMRRFQDAINAEFNKYRTEAKADVTEDNWLQVDADNVNDAVKVINQTPAVKKSGLIAKVVMKISDRVANIGLAKNSTLVTESFKGKFVGTDVSYEDVVLGHNEKRASLDEVLSLAQRIGLKTLGDLENFLAREKEGDETILETLTRYNDELGDEYDEVAATKDIVNEQLNSAKEELTDEQLEQVAVAVSKACDDFEEHYQGVNVVVDQDGQAGEYSTKFFIYENQEKIAETEEIPDEQVVSSPDYYAFIYSALENAYMNAKHEGGIGSLSKQAQEFITEDDGVNSMFTETIKNIEKEFEVAPGTDLTQKNDLTDNIIDNIYFSVPYSKHEYEEDRGDDVYYGDLSDVDFKTRVENATYGSEDDTLTLTLELVHIGDITLQTASRDSGNYYEPPEWDEDETTARGYSTVVVKFPNGSANIEDWEFPGDIDIEDVEVE